MKNVIVGILTLLIVGLMAYTEDIINFRKAFVKVYTPLHQLYYKMRNVQDERR